MELRPRRPGESRCRLLIQFLREQVYRDAYPEGQAFPTELAPVREHGLSRPTVRRAYQDLVAEGLVYRVRGSGTFVTPHRTQDRSPFGFIDDLMKFHSDTDFEPVEPLAAAINPDIAEAEQLITGKAAEEDLADHLSCAPGIPNLHVERTYLDRKGEPLEYAISDLRPVQYSYHSRLGGSVPPR